MYVKSIKAVVVVVVPVMVPGECKERKMEVKLQWFG
jgi:hypothetical protein